MPISVSQMGCAFNFSWEPVIQVGPSFIQVGQTSKIILANYVDLSEFDVTFNDDSLVSLSDDNFTALKTGNLVITVTKKNNSSWL